MKDLTHRRQGFKGLSASESARLIKEAVEIVKNRFCYGVAVTVKETEYEALAPRLYGLRDAHPRRTTATRASQHELVGRHLVKCESRGRIYHAGDFAS